MINYQDEVRHANKNRIVQVRSFPGTRTEDILDQCKSIAIVSQPSKCLKFMTFREGCFVIHVEYRYLSETLETFYYL